MIDRLMSYKVDFMLVCSFSCYCPPSLPFVRKISSNHHTSHIRSTSPCFTRTNPQLPIITLTKSQGSHCPIRNPFYYRFPFTSQLLDHYRLLHNVDGVAVYIIHNVACCFCTYYTSTELLFFNQQSHAAACYPKFPGYGYLPFHSTDCCFWNRFPTSLFV